MKNLGGEDLALVAASIAVKLSKDADFDELCALIELVSLLRHNLEAIKIRRIVLKIEEKEKK